MEEKELNVMDNSSIDGFFARLFHIGFAPEVSIIDPIYKLAHGDPSKGDVALAIIRFSDRLYSTFNCTNVLVHHNLKESYSNTGDKIKKDDSFYGHSFIKNHIRTSYSMKSTGEFTRVLERKKGRGSDTRKIVHMEYDPETNILSQDLTTQKRKGNASDRVMEFLKECREKDRNTTSREICAECDVSYDRLRHIKKEPKIMAVINFQKSQLKNSDIWVPK